MKARDYAAAAALLLALAVKATATAADIEIYFSPNGGAAAAVGREIDAAKKSVHLLAYSISEHRITKALIDAKTRGVEVRLIIDPSQKTAAYSTAARASAAGVPTSIDKAHALMHNKVAIIDQAVVITGSMNFTASGDRQNAENTIILRNTPAAAIYEADFAKHLNHSIPFTRPPAIPSPKPPPTTKEP